MRTIHVIGIGAGDPDYVTAQAVAALNATQVFFAMDKGEAKSDLVGLRRLICERFIDRADYRFVELADPVAAIGRVYRAAGVGPPDLTDLVAAYTRRYPRDAGGRHRYTPQQFGIDPEAIRSRFSFLGDG